MMAAERFDDTKGFKFISYAVWWIRKLIMEAIREKSRVVRIPALKWQDLKRVRAVMSRLEQELERLPTVLELTRAMELPVAEVQRLLAIIPRRISLHAPLEHGEAPTLLDILVEEYTPRPGQRQIELESQCAEVKIGLNSTPFSPIEASFCKISIFVL